MSGSQANDVASGMFQSLDGHHLPDHGDRLTLATHRERTISPADFRSLLQSAQHTCDVSDQAISALLVAGPVLAAWDGDQLVGMMRALSDGVLVAYLEEAVVHPNFRDRDLPTRFLRLLLRELAGVGAINLCCAPGPVGHYEQVGFTVTGNVLLQQHQGLHRNA